jgi:hypothetical protein
VSDETRDDGPSAAERKIVDGIIEINVALLRKNKALEADVSRLTTELEAMARRATELGDQVIKQAEEFPSLLLAAVSKGPPSPTVPDEPCPSCGATGKCACDDFDVLGAIVERSPIPSARYISTRDSHGQPVVTEGRPLATTGLDARTVEACAKCVEEGPGPDYHETTSDVIEAIAFNVRSLASPAGSGTPTGQAPASAKPPGPPPVRR